MTNRRIVLKYYAEKLNTGKIRIIKHVKRKGINMKLIIQIKRGSTPIYSYSLSTTLANIHMHTNQLSFWGESCEAATFAGIMTFRVQ